GNARNGTTASGSSAATSSSDSSAGSSSAAAWQRVTRRKPLTSSPSSGSLPASRGVVECPYYLELFAFAKGNAGGGVKYYFPQDHRTLHATNISGFLDAFPEIEKAAQANTKFSHLLRLYRASLRER